jgi:putative transposase
MARYSRIQPPQCETRRRSKEEAGTQLVSLDNRALARQPLFDKPAEYDAELERVLLAVLDKHRIRVLGYCLMPNHWHCVLWPRRDGQLTAFLRWLSHTLRRRAHYHSQASGPLATKPRILAPSLQL